ncbi:dihydrodipicolinate reductase [Candidatus Sumerlaeota bacterium]|nr:dihydrodipicolinate reductase [Candidatus Sumerlaeota bacterium]
MERLRVVQMGVGAIGREACRLALERSSLELVGAIDADTRIVGQPLSDVLGLNKDCSVVVSNDAEAVLRATSPDVVVHSTSSRLPDVTGQIKQCAGHGADVVSSTEELLFPRLNRPGEAAELEAVALDNKVTILGTGVNPGFVLDTLAVAVTAVCRRVDRIEARRVVDAATRRLPLQRKVGAGLSVAEFNDLLRQGKMGHVGLAESAALVAVGLGWPWDAVEQKTEPVVAQQPVRSEFFDIRPGQVAGVRNIAWAVVGGAEKIRLELEMYVGAADPHDQIVVHGDPSLTVRIPGGIPGDVATAAMLVNAIPAVAEAPPGLLTMLDIPILRCRV